MKKIFTILLIACFTKQLNAQIITTIAGSGAQGYGGDGGQATAAKLFYPGDMCMDAFGNLYITDTDNNRVRKVDTNGTITTIAGTGTSNYSGDGGPATAAELSGARGLVFDAAGNLYITGAHRIRMINTAGVITTFAGNGTAGYTGDGGQATAATLNNPIFLTMDLNNNLYITENTNNCIRKVNSLGVISTAISGLNNPYGAKVDNAKNLYFVESSNHTVKKMDTLGNIKIIAGMGTSGFTGDGGQATAAKLYAPDGITLDALGNLYIVDANNNRIRRVNSSGIINTIAGNGGSGYSGDGGQATAAGMFSPKTVALDVSGNLYISETADNRIRIIYNCSNSTNYPAATFSLSQAASQTWAAFPNYSANITSATWYWGDSSSTVGLYPSHIYTTAGKYNICVTAFSLCGDSSTYCQNDSIYRYSNNSTASNMVYVNVINPNQTTGVLNYNTHNSSIQIYPNPAQNNFTVEVSSNEKQIVNVYDVNGKQVLSQTIQGTTNIDASNLSAGIYNVSIANSTGITNKRLVIVK